MCINEKRDVKMVLILTLVFLSAASIVFGSGQDEAVETGTPVVTVWSHYTDALDDANARVFRQALELAETELPDVIIEHNGTENESYKTKIKTAMSADEGPDVFSVWGAGFLKPFVEAGKVLQLDEYLTDGTAERIKPGAAAFFTFDDKVFGLPMYQWVAVLYCNKDLFEKYNVKYPETFEELLSAAKTFRANGLDPIAVGEKERWPGMFWQNILAMRTAGAKNNQMALAGEARFDTPEYAESAAKLSELVEADAFVKGVLGMSRDEADALFLEGIIPMYYMGNWYVGTLLREESKVKDKVICLNFPTVEGGSGSASEFLGGSINGFCVSEQSPNREAAVKVAKYLTEKVAMLHGQNGTGIPAWNVEINKSNSNPIDTQINDLLRNADNYVLAWDTFLSGLASERHKDLVAEIFGQQIDPGDFAKEMQKLNE